LIDGDKVVCTPGGDDAMLVTLNKLTGETIWKSNVPEAPAAAAGGPGGPPGRGPGGPGDRRGFGGGRGGFGRSGAAYASAIAIDFEGQRQYVQLTGKALVGVAANDGKFLWRYDRAANGAGINCATPLYHDGKVFASSAYGAGGGLVKLTKEGDGTIKAEEVYFARKMQNHHGGMILHEGSLYGANGGNEGGFLVCLDFDTGKVLWDQRTADEPRALKGSVAFADGRLYYRNESGTVLLIEPSPKEYAERGSFDQPDRSDRPAWSHPVIANGKLYLRDQSVLLCYDVKAK
jgi:outer membrane protein assembly factor BamB